MKPGTEEHRVALHQELSALPLSARRLAAGLLSGLHRSVQRGGSAEFAEHVEYAAGDDPRNLDWRASARRDRLLIRRFEETTHRRAQLLLDASASMAFQRRDRPSKLDLARTVLGALATLLLRQGDAVGVSVLRRDEASDHVPSKSRGAHLAALLARLDKVTPRGKTDLGRALDTVGARLPRRSLILLASDLIDDGDRLGAALRRLHARGHDLVVVQVLEEDELRFPFVGSRRFRDPETGEVVTSDATAVAEHYREELQRFLTDCDATCATARAERVLLSTGEDPGPALVSWLAQRQALARRLVAAA
ncbi:MAG: DUF58 domain-containing protein [Acidobacteriota bacterium]